MTSSSSSLSLSQKRILASPKGKDLWGRHTWKYNHIVANGFDPTRSSYYIENISAEQNLLPCVECRQHFSQLLQNKPLSNYIDNNINFQHGIYIYHDTVNKRYNIEHPTLVQKQSPPFKSIVDYYNIITPHRVQWEESMWITFYCIAASYSPEHSNDAITFFSTLPYVLPTVETRNEFQYLLHKYPITSYLDSNHNLFFWVYLINNAYNKNIGSVNLHPYDDFKRYIFRGLGDDCRQCQL